MPFRNVVLVAEVLVGGFRSWCRLLVKWRGQQCLPGRQAGHRAYGALICKEMVLIKAKPGVATIDMEARSGS